MVKIYLRYKNYYNIASSQLKVRSIGLTESANIITVEKRVE